MNYQYQLFYMEPPIKLYKKPQLHNFEDTDFDTAYKTSKVFIKNKKPGTQILMLAQLDR